MKMNLLFMVQNILAAMDAEEVNTIGDTSEAVQVAGFVRDTFYNMTTNRDIPEHWEFAQLVSFSDNLRPTHFSMPENTEDIGRLWYDTSLDDTFLYSDVKFLAPMDFLTKIDGVSGNFVNVKDVNAGTNLRIRNDKHPEYWTSFDDQTVVMDSFIATVDDTLTSGKTRAYLRKTPPFTLEDDFIPDIDQHLFPQLLAEAKSVSQSLLKSGSDPKVEQAARRLKSLSQANKHNTPNQRRLSNYGRN